MAYHSNDRTGFIARFTECYQAMSNNRKWLLPSGDFLEDILYQHFRDEQVELAAHSWVVDTRDPRVECCFEPEDWKAICDQIPSLPEPDKPLVESMRRFMGVSEICNMQPAFVQVLTEHSYKLQPSFEIRCTPPHFYNRASHSIPRSIRVQPGSTS